MYFGRPFGLGLMPIDSGETDSGGGGSGAGSGHGINLPSAGTKMTFVAPSEGRPRDPAQPSHTVVPVTRASPQYIKVPTTTIKTSPPPKIKFPFTNGGKTTVAPPPPSVAPPSWMQPHVPLVIAQMPPGGAGPVSVVPVTTPPVATIPPPPTPSSGGVPLVIATMPPAGTSTGVAPPIPSAGTQMTIAPPAEGEEMEVVVEPGTPAKPFWKKPIVWIVIAGAAAGGVFYYRKHR